MTRIVDLSEGDIKDGFSGFVNGWLKFAADNAGKFKDTGPKDVIAFGKSLSSNKQQLSHLARNIQFMMANKAGLPFAQKGRETSLAKHRDWKPSAVDKIKVKVQKAMVKVALHERKGELSLVLHRMTKQSVLLAQGGSPINEKSMLTEVGGDEELAQKDQSKPSTDAGAVAARGLGKASDSGSK